MNERTLVYALLVRAGVLGAFFYQYHTLPSLTAGLIGAILGLAGGVYLDRSRSERSIGDNIAFGLILSAILRYADVYYGITALTPSSYRLSLIAVSIAVMASALSSEAITGVPARIPLLGLFAVILAFVLVFSAVTTTSISAIQRYSGGSYPAGTGINGYDEFRMPVKYYRSNGTEVLIRMSVPNATSYTFSLSYTDSSGSSADAVRYFFVPIRSNRSVTLDGEEFRPKPGMIITVTFTFGSNVTEPDRSIAYILPGGQLNVVETKEGSNDVVNTTYTVRFEITETVKLANAIYIVVERSNRGPENYPATPLIVSIERKIAEKKDVSTSYLIGAIIALGIAVIDALPLDSSRPKRVRRKRRKKARR